MKIFVLLPDGVGLRNFAFSNFAELGEKEGHEIIYWNNTQFPLNKELGLDEISIKKSKTHPFSDLYKRARKNIELAQNIEKFKDETYNKYKFKQSYKGVKNFAKSSVVDVLSSTLNSEKGLKKVRERKFAYERKTQYYQNVQEQLREHKPDIVFCTNQRTLTAIAPLLAAQDLQIPTATFIFSWDNLPKATLVVETDYYFVWGEYMKAELLKYYPHIQENQIKITGTPQFEPHFQENLYIDKEVFFKEYNLDLEKKYICFSGDDITTSPNDQYYLEDLALTVRKLNEEGNKLGIIYRKCPVDFSGRHEQVLEKYKDVIVCIDPLWRNFGNGWDSAMPTKEDAQLLVNTILHTELVINVGSSMAFDAVSHDKPCIYINYDVDTKDRKMSHPEWTIQKIYKYIHFRSMPNKEAVLWGDSIQVIEEQVRQVLKKEYSLESTKDWFSTICNQPQNSGKIILESLKDIVEINKNNK